MKYYTKQWNSLYRNYHLDLFQVIPDGNYSDKEISALYEKALKESIEEERRFYDTSPNSLLQEILDKMTFEEGEWITVDEKNGTYRYVQSLEELKANLENGSNESKSFDSSVAIENFQVRYENLLKQIDYYPDWVRNEVDPRLIALGFMPDSVYKKLKLQEKENRRIFKIADHKAKKEMDLQWGRIPDRIRTIFRIGNSPVLEEACLLFLEKKENNIILIFCYGAWQQPADSRTPYVRIIFEDAELLECEANIQLEYTKRFRYVQENELSANENEVVISDCMYEADELYLIDADLYEYHLMVSGSAYITIRCKNIICLGDDGYGYTIPEINGKRTGYIH